MGISQQSEVINGHMKVIALAESAQMRSDLRGGASWNRTSDLSIISADRYQPDCALDLLGCHASFEEFARRAPRVPHRNRNIRKASQNAGSAAVI